MSFALSELLENIGTLAMRVGRQDLSSESRRLASRYAAKEWFVLLLGETSSGKSTFANSLMCEPLLPATPGATTCVPVEIRIVDVSMGKRFEKTDNNGAVSEISRDEFRGLCATKGAVARLHVYWPIAEIGERGKALRGLVLLDMPGYNSCVGEHAKTLADVIPEADATIMLLSFRRGFTPEDLQFLQAIRSLRGDDDSPVLFAVNWMPEDSTGERKLAKMTAGIRKATGQAPLLFPLRRDTNRSYMAIHDEQLLDELERIAVSSSREAAIEHHILRLATGICDDIRGHLVARAESLNAACSHLRAVEEKIATNQELQKKAIALIDRARTEMKTTIDHQCASAKNTVWNEIDECVDDANRFTDASQCTAFINGHVLPHGLNIMKEALFETLGEQTDVLGSALDDLEIAAEGAPISESTLDEPEWAWVRDYSVKKGISRAVGAAFGSYLGRLGGAGGEKAGFVNLAKKVVSKVGKAFNRRFSRALYDNMGKTLRRIGMGAEMAGSAIALAVIEVLKYGYTVIRWKARLRGMAQRTLGLPANYEPLEDALLQKIPFLRKERKLPLLELAAAAANGVEETMNATADVVNLNFGRRLAVLEEALAAKPEGTDRALGEIQIQHRELSSIEDRLRNLEQEMKT